jgi:hypothetical protein
MHLKAAIGACRNEPDRVLRSVIPLVAIANPAFVPDAWRIQEDRMAGPARARTKCSVQRQCSIRTLKPAMGPITDASALSSVTMNLQLGTVT